MQTNSPLPDILVYVAVITQASDLGMIAINTAVVLHVRGQTVKCHTIIA